MRMMYQLIPISTARHYSMFNITETIQDRHGYYKPMTKSDMWPTELCHR